MFAPAIGIKEDPVTGNANGPLGGYLLQNKIVNFENNLFEFNGSHLDADSLNYLPACCSLKGFHFFVGWNLVANMLRLMCDMLRVREFTSSNFS
jgi:hypothetical protein